MSASASPLHALARGTFARRLSLLWLLTIGAAALFADLLPLADPTQMALTERNSEPSLRHLLGTDAFGRDLLSRTLYGARVSLLVAVLCPALGLLIGGVGGVLAGYLGGWADRLARILTDTLLALPALIIALLLNALFGGSLSTIVWSLGLLSSPAFLRVARVRSRVTASQLYVEAARGLGAGTVHTLRRHVLPNVMPTLITLYALVAAVLIVVEGALGFLGLGVSPPTPSWGGMIAEGRASLETRPHVVLVPAMSLVATVLALNLVIDRREALADEESGR